MAHPNIRMTRLTFGKYLADQLAELSNRPANRDRFTRVHGEAVALTRTPQGIVVTLDNFRRVLADVAVVASATVKQRRQGNSGPITLQIPD